MVGAAGHTIKVYIVIALNSYALEVSTLLNHIDYTINNVTDWLKREPLQVAYPAAIPFKASLFGKNAGHRLSANIFNRWWNEGNNPNAHAGAIHKPASLKQNIEHKAKETDGLFSFLDRTTDFDNTANYSIAGLLPSDQSEDFEELEFDNKMKRRLKRKR